MESSIHEYSRYGAQYDWDAGYGITLNGTDVSGWKDRIQGRTWLQSTAAAQPQYATSVINGNNAVFANNTNKFMTSNIPVTIGDNYWVAWVFLDSNAGAVIGPHNTGGFSNINPTRPVIGNSSLGYVGAFCSSKGVTSVGGGRYVLAGSTSNWFVVIFTRTKIFVNGVSEPIVGVADYKSQASLDRLFRSTGNQLQTTGYLTRLVIGNQALSDSSLLEMSNALNTTYAIY
jgi:hypothetical protein